MIMSFLDKPVPAAALRLYDLRTELEKFKRAEKYCQRKLMITSVPNETGVHLQQWTDLVNDKLDEVIHEERELHSHILCEWVKKRIELEKATSNMANIDDLLTSCSH